MLVKQTKIRADDWTEAFLAAKVQQAIAYVLGFGTRFSPQADLVLLVH
jgi:hypothetical protein